MSMRAQIESINAKMEWRLSKMREHREEIGKLRSEKAAFYVDSGMMPFSLMDDAQRAKILKMELLESPCEFCGKSGGLRKGNKLVCVDCGHVNGL